MRNFLPSYWQSVFLAAVSALACGCASIEREPLSRTWSVDYLEEAIIDTEPQGAKIYLQEQYVGVSPVTVKLNGGKATLTQRGYMEWSVSKDLLGGEFRSPGGETWNNSLEAEPRRGSWTIQAFRDGSQPATRTIDLTSSDDVFRKAFENVSRDNLPGNVLGHRRVLISLVPERPRDILLPSPPPTQQQQQQQQQQTVIVGNSAPQGTTMGTVTLTADVADAEIYVDGAFVGNAPATLKLTEGMHILEVKKAGLQGYKRELRVLGNSDSNIRATLK